MGLSVFRERLRVHHGYDRFHALDALSEVLFVVEVVECDRGIVVGVRVLQLQMARRSWAVYFLEDYTALDPRVDHQIHGFVGLGFGFIVSV